MSVQLPSLCGRRARATETSSQETSRVSNVNEEREAESKGAFERDQYCGTVEADEAEKDLRSRNHGLLDDHSHGALHVLRFYILAR